MFTWDEAQASFDLWACSIILLLALSSADTEGFLAYPGL